MPRSKSKRGLYNQRSPGFPKNQPQHHEAVFETRNNKAYWVGGTWPIWGSEFLQLVSPKLESKVYTKVYKVYDKIREKNRKSIKRW